MPKMLGHTFKSVKFKRKDKVLSLVAAKCSVKIGSIPVIINPLLLFQRICIAKKSDDELKEYLQYELAPFPFSMFTEDGMRKVAKSSLYKAYMPVTPVIEVDTTIHIIDGCFLLNRACVGPYYGTNTIVAFDGYPKSGTETSTKSAERNRCSKQHCNTDILFDESMIPTVSQEQFLPNSFNKKCFIALLQTKLKAHNYNVKQAIKEADSLIVQTPIQLPPSFYSIFVIGENVVMLVLLTAKAREIPNFYLRKPGRGKKEDVFYSL
ncbi:unnamed protein product [Psylliodes chrysocephalus]|uniref:Uncharacterized protein n=1 Tax=Psylliodes chrysocephalus TaxID=3402493 RepID=A0A9P0D6W2_9CUCU|nr:unnamed protein product [Psylliodes chrysocephala]